MQPVNFIIEYAIRVGIEQSKKREYIIYNEEFDPGSG